MRRPNLESRIQEGDKRPRAAFGHGWPPVLRSGTAEGGRISTDGKKVEKGVWEGGWRQVLAENGCAQLYAFIRIYRLLYKVSEKR